METSCCFTNLGDFKDVASLKAKLKITKDKFSKYITIKDLLVFFK